MFKKQKTKYKVVFLRKEYKTMNVVKTLNVKSLTDTIRIGKKSWTIDWQFPSYNTGLTKIYFLDWTTGNQLLFDAIERELNPNELDLIVGTKIVKEIASGVLDNKKTLIMYFIFGLIMGGLLAALIVMSVMQQKIDTVVESTTYMPIPMIPTGGLF